MGVSEEWIYALLLLQLQLNQARATEEKEKGNKAFAAKKYEVREYSPV